VKIYVAVVEALGKKERGDMKLSLPPKLVQKLVWVPVILFVKFHSQLRVDALLLPKLAILAP
jgi:hypothetical protein